jgi:hypothetical protein
MAIPTGYSPVATVGVACAASAPPGPTVYCDTPPDPSDPLLTTYTCWPFGLTAI